jgi:protein-S-isoprenylcysteine O-methyltransferase Ste14
MLKIAAFTELFVCWISWMLAFVAARKKAAGQQKVVRAPASQWGIVLQGIGFALVSVYLPHRQIEKSAISFIAAMVLAPLPVALAWTATRHLGKQWRLEAALSKEHELIQTGPYRWVRHPIYVSMLGMLLAIGAARAWWPLFIAGILVFLIGTEIRVRAEERLLAERFSGAFRAYRSRTAAYLPLIR